MSIINALARLTELELDALTGFKCVLINKSQALVEGDFSVSIFNDKNILLKTKNHIINIGGSGLYIKELSKNEIIITGTIDKIEL